MSKTIGNNLLNHLQQDTTSLAMLWKITTTNNTVKAFTNHNSDIIYNNTIAK